MATPPKSPLDLALTYHGAGPIYWRGGPDDFGLQDTSGALLPGAASADGAVTFALSLEVKTGRTGAPELSGPFAHGPPARRFLYLSWRDPEGAYAQRLIIPLTEISADQIRQALAAGAPLVARLEDHHPRATSTGANIGGTRQVAWSVGG